MSILFLFLFDVEFFKRSDVSVEASIKIVFNNEVK